jgi:DnaJ-class molecular chaperone
MRPQKKDKPLAVCTVCQALTDRHEYRNNRCNQIVAGRRCSGQFQSALTRLWDECQGCTGTGKVGTQVCTECKGFGWNLYS